MTVTSTAHLQVQSRNVQCKILEKFKSFLPANSTLGFLIKEINVDLYKLTEILQLTASELTAALFFLVKCEKPPNN